MFVNEHVQISFVNADRALNWALSDLRPTPGFDIDLLCDLNKSFHLSVSLLPFYTVSSVQLVSSLGKGSPFSMFVLGPQS